MTRLPRNVAVATVFGAAFLLGGGAATAQHWHSGSGHHHYQPGSSIYQPGHFDWHGNHYDYHPGQYIYRPPTHTHQPPVIQRYQSYPSVRRDPYSYGHESHSHDHAGPSRVQYQFGGFSHIDDLAVQLEQDANQLCLELHYNYQHNPGFRETYREAYEILTTAKYIHGLEHSGNRDKLRQAAAELDQLFHHVHQDVATWTAHYHRRVGQDGLTGKIARLETTLHHLMDDVGVRTQYGDDQAPAPANETAPPAAPRQGSSPPPPPSSNFDLVR